MIPIHHTEDRGYAPAVKLMRTGINTGESAGAQWFYAAPPKGSVNALMGVRTVAGVNGPEGGRLIAGLSS